MAAPSPPDPARERVTFIQNQVPGLDAGVYRLRVEQHVLEADDKTPVSTDEISRDYHLAVGGPRFRLADPAGTVSSVFPASNATGDFHTVLPHVVLGTPALPWIRSPISTNKGLSAEPDVPSWLAVLTLDSTDAAAHPGLLLDPVGVTVGDLFPIEAYPPSKLPAGTRSYFEGATDTGGLDPGESVDDPIQVLDLPAALFTAIAPSLSDLGLNSHVRQLSLQSKPTLLGAEPPTDPLGTYAIVIGNRLPQSLQTSHAYLVSLEALSPLLPPAGSVIGSVRLAVLAHWTFVSQAAPIDFTTTVASLNGRTPDGPDAAVTTLRLNPGNVGSGGVGAAIGAALGRGYAPLTHQLRTGETTVSWIRGPLSPDDSPPPADLPVPYTCSDAALVFDPTTGLFDASLAAAWTIGRLVALQDKAFSTALYSWKRGLTRVAVDAAERELIAEVLGEDQISDQDTSKPLLHATMRLLAQGRTP